MGIHSRDLHTLAEGMRRAGDVPSRYRDALSACRRGARRRDRPADDVSRGASQESEQLTLRDMRALRRDGKSPRCGVVDLDHQAELASFDRRTWHLLIESKSWRHRSATTHVVASQPSPVMTPDLVRAMRSGVPSSRSSTRGAAGSRLVARGHLCKGMHLGPCEPDARPPALRGEPHVNPPQWTGKPPRRAG